MKVELNFPFSYIVCCFSSFGFSVQKNIRIADNNEVIFVLATQVNVEYRALELRYCGSAAPFSWATNQNKHIVSEGRLHETCLKAAQKKKDGIASGGEAKIKCKK